LHIAGGGRGIFVAVDDVFAAFEIFVVRDPDFRAGVVDRYFSGHALRVLVENLRGNIGVLQQIKYYLRFHQIAGGINFFHAVRNTQ